MSRNGFYISDTAYEQALQIAEHDLAAMAHSKSVNVAARDTPRHQELEGFRDAQRRSVLVRRRATTPAAVPEAGPKSSKGTHVSCSND